MDNINKPTDSGTMGIMSGSGVLHSPPAVKRFTPYASYHDIARVPKKSLNEYKIEQIDPLQYEDMDDHGYWSDESSNPSTPDREELGDISQRSTAKSRKRPLSESSDSEPISRQRAKVGLYALGKNSVKSIIPLSSDVKLLEQCTVEKPGNGSVIVEGLNSIFILKDSEQRPQFIFKPAKGESEFSRNGEPLSTGISAGTFYIRELVPMLLNEEEFFPVPKTFVWEFDSPGSCQRFVPDATTMGRKIIRGESTDSIDKDDLKRLAILDIIIGNQDRHLDNILISENHAIGIDHGLSMSRSHDDKLKIDTPNIPQYKGKVSDEVIDYCQSLYLEKSVNLQQNLLDLGVEPEAITCCLQRIKILYELLTASRKNEVYLSVHEIVHCVMFLLKHSSDDDFEQSTLSKIDELVNLKKEINELFQNGKRSQILRIKHNAQLPNKKFIQDEMAKRLNIPAEDACHLWRSAFLPVLE